MEARKTAIRFAVSKDIFLPLFNLLLTNFSIQLVKYHRVIGQIWFANNRNNVTQTSGYYNI